MGFILFSNLRSRFIDHVVQSNAGLNQFRDLAVDAVTLGDQAVPQQGRVFLNGGLDTGQQLAQRLARQTRRIQLLDQAHPGYG